MTSFICVTCAVQQASTDGPPERCPICEDERQYVRQGGQAWTTLDELARKGHRTVVRDLESGLSGIGVEPSLGIGQRALLVRTPRGNFLWDCVGFIDEAAVKAVRARGGIAGIAMSHPHFYGAMVEWSRAFGNAPIYVPSADAEWVQYDDPAIVHWERAREVLPGVTLVQCGGHFEGSAVLHWAAGAEGRGALLVGDTITVVPDVRFVSFMRSYPITSRCPPSSSSGSSPRSDRFGSIASTAGGGIASCRPMARLRSSARRGVICGGSARATR